MPLTTDPFDVVIVGAGVVGCAIARELSHYNLAVALVDGSSDVGDGTSKANTAILHTGFDATPQTLESNLVARGYDLLSGYARQAGIPFRVPGAWLVAWDSDQLEALPTLAQKATENGYLHTRLVGIDELYEGEPHLGAGALGALEVPGEGIICPWTTTLAYATQAVLAGVELMLSTTVTDIGAAEDDIIQVQTDGGPLRTRWLINAAGLSSDLVDHMFGHDDFSITARRGELIVFDKLASLLVTRVLLPVPTSKGKGVLIAPTVYGNVMLGPTSEDLDDRTDSGSSEDGLKFLIDKGRQLMPELVEEEVTTVYAGLRAATEHKDYQIRINPRQHYVCVGGIRSTGLTASMAIAEYVLQLMVEAGLETGTRSEGTVPVMPNIGEIDPRPYARSELIAADSSYGTIVCHCERVTLGEIRDALASTIPATTVEGLRRRTRVLMGRCQGFYCGAEVRDLLSAEVTAP